MLEKIIEAVFQTKKYELKNLDKGLTNHNYLLSILDCQYVVRVPRNDSSHLVNRKNEKEVNNEVKDLDVETIYFNDENGIKISKYIEGVSEFKDCLDSNKIERCAYLMKKLHTHPAPSFHFNPSKTLALYKRHIQNPFYDLSMYDETIQKVNHFHNKEVLCHNDFVSGNILYSKKRDYLIDYEYAAANDPLFDVISFLSENQIFDQDLRERFYNTYFEKMNDTLYKQLYLWEIFQNVLWCNWAMMMYEARKEEIYKKIAKDKYDALKRME